MLKSDEQWMVLALAEASKAASAGEVPIASVTVGANGQLLASAANATISQNDPTAHAEIIALRLSAKALGNYRLTGVTVYSTLEPCAMCAGALVNARIARLVYGAQDKRFGAVETHFGICTSSVLNHRIEVVSGVCADQSRDLLQEFFRVRRAPK